MEKAKQIITAIICLGPLLLLIAYLALNTPPQQVKAKIEQPKEIVKPEIKPKELTTDELLAKYFKPQDVKMARAIMLAESGGDPQNHGDKSLTYYRNGKLYGDSFGLFQIRHLPGRPDPEWLLVPENNIQYASQMYYKQGWTPWSVYKNNKYKEKL